MKWKGIAQLICLCEWGTKGMTFPRQAHQQNQTFLSPAAREEMLIVVEWEESVNFIPLFNHQSKINKTIQSKKFD